MKTIKIHPAGGLSIPLGVEGEHLAREIVFDCAALAAAYGTGTAAVFHRREQDAEATPVAVSQDGCAVTWTVTNADTACRAGSPSPVARGECVIEWLVGDAVAKTLTMKTMVVRSITTSEEDPPEPVAYWYAKLLEAFEAGGTVDPAAIAEAVQAYLTANPVEAPVTSVNDKTGAVTLTAEDVGAMQGKSVYYWTYGAVDSHNNVFDIFLNYDFGIVTGQSPAGMTAPMLVLSGALSYGVKDFFVIDANGRMWTGKYRMGMTEIQSLTRVYPTPAEIGAATPDDVTAAAQEAVEASKALGMTGAEVGQIAKITAVDDDGVPTAWEAVDMPSGGGGGGDEWELLAEFDTSTAEVFQQDFDAPMRKIYFHIAASDTAGEQYSASKTAYRSLYFAVGGAWKLVNIPLGMCSHTWGYRHILRVENTDAFTWGGYVSTLTSYSGALNLFPLCGLRAHYASGDVSGVKVIQTLPDDTTNESTGTIKVWGVRA